MSVNTICGSFSPSTNNTFFDTSSKDATVASQVPISQAVAVTAITPKRLSPGSVIAAVVCVLSVSAGGAFVAILNFSPEMLGRLFNDLLSNPNNQFIALVIFGASAIVSGAVAILVYVFSGSSIDQKVIDGCATMSLSCKISNDNKSIALAKDKITVDDSGNLIFESGTLSQAIPANATDLRINPLNKEGNAINSIPVQIMISWPRTLPVGTYEVLGFEESDIPALEGVTMIVREGKFTIDGLKQEKFSLLSDKQRFLLKKGEQLWEIKLEKSLAETDNRIEAMTDDRVYLFDGSHTWSLPWQSLPKPGLLRQDIYL
jgi:hypothetical protein